MEIAPFEPGEAAYARRVALLREAQPEEPWSGEGERAADEGDREAGREPCAFFAREAGEEVGFARAQADPDVPVPGRRRLWVAVRHASRRRGIGTALLAAAGEAAAAGGATEFHASTSLAEPDGLAFALARGFREAEAEYELHLDLAAFDPARLPPAAPATGRVVTLACLQAADPGWLERYYRLHTAVEAAVPWALGFALPAREAFRRAHVDAAEALPEVTAIAVAGGEWVGLCEMWRSGDDTHTAYEELTGVLPEHRGRGWGTALVAAAAAGAKARGYRRLLTSTSTSNEAMQRTARRLGFRVAATWAHLLGPATRPRVPSGVEVRP